MRINNLLNSFFQGANFASSALDAINDKDISLQDIDAYFKILDYLLSKYANNSSAQLTKLYWHMAKNEPLFSTPAENKIFAGIVDETDLALHKSGAMEMTVAALNIRIEKDFSELYNFLLQNKELALYQNLQIRNAMLSLTPVIKTKIKKALSERKDYIQQLSNNK